MDPERDRSSCSSRRRRGLIYPLGEIRELEWCSEQAYKRITWRRAEQSCRDHACLCPAHAELRNKEASKRSPIHIYILATGMFRRRGGRDVNYLIVVRVL